MKWSLIIMLGVLITSCSPNTERLENSAQITFHQLSSFGEELLDNTDSLTINVPLDSQNPITLDLNSNSKFGVWFTSHQSIASIIDGKAVDTSFTSYQLALYQKDAGEWKSLVPLLNTIDNSVVAKKSHIELEITSSEILKTNYSYKLNLPRVSH